LTALFGVDHARTLAIIAPRLYEAKFKNKQEKLTQYGRRVWNLQGDDISVAKQAIAKTEEFFNSLGIETKISAYSQQVDDIHQIIKARFEERGWNNTGERQDLTYDEVEEILKNAI
jgi:NADP-dependent alcohol dehydrogenase